MINLDAATALIIYYIMHIVSSLASSQFVLGSNFNNLRLFHFIVHNMSCINLPSYLHFFKGQSRLRFSHLDHLSLISDVIPAYNFRNTKRGFKNSYFYRTHLLWNRLPLYSREIIRLSEVKSKLMDHIWTHLVTIENTSDDEFYESGELFTNIHIGIHFIAWNFGLKKLNPAHISIDNFIEHR